MKIAVTALFTACIATAAHAQLAASCSPHWSAVPGTPGMSDGYVADMQVYDDGSGPQLYACGSFAQAGGAAGSSLIARWTGSGWQGLGGGLIDQYGNALTTFGGSLYAGGYFNSADGVKGSAKLAKWNGTEWTNVDAQLDGFDDSVWALKTYNDGSGEALYVAGNYTGIGGTAINHLARYDGSTFTQVGTGTIAGNVPLIVIELETWNNELYIGGRFTSVAGVSASRIAKWNGLTWSGLDTGITGTGVGVAVYAIEPWDDGTGPSLFIGGQSITAAGGVPTTGVARWDGAHWHSVGGGIAGTVWDLKVFDDGSGESLYAVGTFTSAGGTPMNRIAKWDGNTWQFVGTGTGADATVFCALPYDDGSGPALYIGGSFTSVEGLTTNRVARYQGCAAPPCGPGDVTCDGVVNIDDLLGVITGWGQSGPPGSIAADVTHNGVVDIDDLLFVISNWG